MKRLLRCLLLCFALLARFDQQIAGAVRRAAIAAELLLPILGLILVHSEAVVVAEFFAGLDRASRFDENAALVFHRFAIRIARVIDEARVIALHGGINAHVAIANLKEKGVMPLHRSIIIAAVGFIGGNQFARVFDNARAFTNRLLGKRAFALNLGTANGKIGISELRHQRRKYEI